MVILRNSNHTKRLPWEREKKSLKQLIPIAEGKVGMTWNLKYTELEKAKAKFVCSSLIY